MAKPHSGSSPKRICFTLKSGSTFVPSGFEIRLESFRPLAVVFDLEMLGVSSDLAEIKSHGVFFLVDYRMWTNLPSGSFGLVTSAERRLFGEF